MRSIHTDVWLRGGVAATFELLADGHSSHQLTRAVRSGEIIRARHGHYVSPTLSDDEIGAVRVGGRLTGLSGARRLGIWAPTATKLQVRTGAHARALRSPVDHTRRLRAGEAAIRWRAPNSAGTRTTMSAIDCLHDILRTEPPRVAFACVESALHRGLIRFSEAAALVAGAPRRTRRLLDAVGRKSESGTESMMSFDLAAAGIAFRQQVEVAGVGRVDFLIGDKLVIEADGAGFHSSPESFERDRDRDAELGIRGYRVLRFSYRQLTFTPGVVMRAITAAITRGDHH